MKLKSVLFILLVMILLGACSSNNDITTMDLIVYGTSDTPQTYSVEDKAIINDLIDMINSITIKDNYVSKRDGFDLPKGISYELKFIGKQSKEYQFIYNYLVYDNNIYDVTDYQTVIIESFMIFYS